VVVEPTRLFRVSVSFATSSAGAEKLLSTETGIPALLPGNWGLMKREAVF
jgi:hypothetical protein